MSLRQESTRHSSHSMAGFLDDVGKFFDGLGNDDNEQSSQSEIVEEIDGVYTGSTRIITIPGELCDMIFCL